MIRIVPFNFLYLFPIVLLVCTSCSQNRKKPTLTEVLTYKEHLVTINKLIVEHIADSIKKQNERHNWGLVKSRTGLWYKIYHVGKGDSAKVNLVASLSYRLRLFDGRMCYNTDTTGPKNIVIGRSGMETGLEEGLLLMRVGDSALLVLPPHLAHGLIGDQKKIPRMAIISYTVILQGLQKQEDE